MLIVSTYETPKTVREKLTEYEIDVKSTNLMVLS
jgi:hypothetical protein